MPSSHPYISGPQNIVKIVEHLRKKFPRTVNAETLKKLGLAPNNESYLINILQFVGIIDGESKQTAEAKTIFVKHIDEEFQEGLGQLVKKAYHDLFDLHGDEAWKLSKDELISFFRQTDETSDVIGGRQAATFLVFVALSGHGEIPVAKSKTGDSAKKRKPTNNKVKPSSLSKENQQKSVVAKSASNYEQSSLALTVRVEINLPSDGSKDTYDAIFKSIKENLLNEQ